MVQFRRLVLSSFAFVAVAPGVALAECPSCDLSVELTRQEWRCLAGRIDRYQRIHMDPVFVPVSRCQEANAVAERSDPTIAPRGQYGGDGQHRRAMRLSQVQLRCLREHIGQIVARNTPTEKFDFVRECPAAPQSMGATNE